MKKRNTQQSLEITKEKKGKKEEEENYNRCACIIKMLSSCRK